MTTAPVIETVQVAHPPNIPGVVYADYPKHSNASPLIAWNKYVAKFGIEPPEIYQTATGYMIPFPDGWRESED